MTATSAELVFAHSARAEMPIAVCAWLTITRVATASWHARALSILDDVPRVVDDAF